MKQQKNYNLSSVFLQGIVICVLMQCFLSGLRADLKLRVEHTKQSKTIDDLNVPQPKKYDTWLGIFFYILQTKQRDYLKVHGVFPQSPAEKAGVKKHDQILTLADKPVNSILEMRAIVETYPPDSTIALEYERENKKYRTSIRVEKKEDIKDFLHKQLPMTTFEDRANGKSLKVIVADAKIKIIYFWYAGFPPSIKIKKQLINFVRSSAKNNVQLIMFTTLDEEASDQFLLPAKPYQNLSDFSMKIEMTFRVHQIPAIIVADKNNIIRFADYVDETTISKPLEIIRKLLKVHS